MEAAFLIRQNEKSKQILMVSSEFRADWLEAGLLQKLVLVITSAVDKEVLERWTFDIVTDANVLEGNLAVEKPEKEITAEIQAIIRQITASVTFLPLLNDPCTFDLLVSWQRAHPTVSISLMVQVFCCKNR